MASLVPPSSFSVSSSYCREEDDEEQSTADGNNIISLLPKVIHFTSSSSSAVTDSGSSSSSSSNANADADYITPIKSSKSSSIRSPQQRQHGILKSSSYKKKSFNNDVSSTPSTVATVETIMSFDSNSSASVSVSASASGGTVNTSSVTSSNSSASAETTPISSSSSLAVLVATRPAALFATPPRLRLSSSSVSLSTVDSSTSSFSTSTSNSKTSSSTVLTEKQRNARIKHIEDLNERIQEAKQNKIITKNKYKKEDKLILKLARNLKRSCNETVKNELKIKHLEEENEQIKTNWLTTRKELNELKHIRIQIENKLQTNHQQHLEKERIRQNTIVDDQKQQLIKTNTDHQLYCHGLCVNVLDANTELNRLRDTMNIQLSKEEKEKQRIRNKYSKSGRTRRRRRLVLLMAGAAVAAILSLLLVSQGTTNIASLLDGLAFLFEEKEPQDHRSSKTTMVTRDNNNNNSNNVIVNLFSAATCSATSTKNNISSLFSTVMLPDHQRVLTTTETTTTTTTTSSSNSSSNSSSSDNSRSSKTCITTEEDYDIPVNADEDAAGASSLSAGGTKFFSFERYGSKVKEVLVAASILHQG